MKLSLLLEGTVNEDISEMDSLLQSAGDNLSEENKKDNKGKEIEDSSDKAIYSRLQTDTERRKFIENKEEEYRAQANQKRQEQLDYATNLSESDRRRLLNDNTTNSEYLETQSQKSVFIYALDKNCDRASDYDDWSLNGDLIIWSDAINAPIEISSMGIRVDKNALEYQLEECDENWKKKFDYHKMILSGELPPTIGGGIGQSRLCMLLMQRKHIGEVQSSVWDDNNIQYAEANNLTLL